MENKKYKIELGIIELNKKIKFMKLLLFFCLLFLFFSVMHCIWITNWSSLRLSITGVFIGGFFLLIDYVFKELRKDLENELKKL